MMASLTTLQGHSQPYKDKSDLFLHFSIFFIKKILKRAMRVFEIFYKKNSVF